MNIERRHAIIRVLRGKIANATISSTIHISPTLMQEIVAMLDEQPKAGLNAPTYRQRESMLDVLGVYLHSPSAARTVLEAVLRAAGSDRAPSEQVSGFSPFQTTR